MTHGTTQNQAAGKGGVIAWAIAGVFALVIGANGVMIAIAVGAKPDLVSSTYYEDAKQHDARAALRQAGQALGWRLEPQPGGATREGLALLVRDAGGKPVNGLAGRVAAYRPADVALDQAVAFSPLPGGKGAYVLRFARPAPGRWRLTLTLEKGGQRLVRDLPVVLP